MSLNSKPPKQSIDLTKEARPRKFYETLPSMHAGDEIIYWCGEFAGGRLKPVAMRAYEDGYVHLIQKRGPGRTFYYIAQRSKKRWKKENKQ